MTFALLTYELKGQAPWQGQFEQLGKLLPTPNSYRTADGAPGPDYWQQQADYKIKVTLDDENQRIYGEEVITYHNNSPDDLTYLWLQLDQNVRAKGNLNEQTRNTSISEYEKVRSRQLVVDLAAFNYDGGYELKSVSNIDRSPLDYIVNRTMMRLELPEPLASGKQFQFAIKWSYNVYDRMKLEGRGGYEYFPKDDNYLYTIAQWYPRMCVYDDVVGWQNKQFIENGEFALTFGNFEVEITAPKDHIVAATGMLQNPNDVLTDAQKIQLEKAKNSFDKPIIIANEKEALNREGKRSKETSIWKFRASNVRDFAFASSRKFIWDAQAVKLPTNTVLAMSYYPKEGNPLWERESTKAVKNTLEVYSERLFDYPYPVAISVNSADQGMEYPMISFNSGRPQKNGKYGKHILAALTDVVIHEAGHNYFPMIVNSDEKLYAWMDEGINSFFELETKRARYPEQQNWGTAQSIAPYLGVEQIAERPPMTNPENLLFPSVSSYGKPSAALDILRQVIMGPELFDHAIKEYANRWRFKHPKPADFFRTMEDASGVDLDWFWRGWFFESKPVDIAIQKVKWFKTDVDRKEMTNNDKWSKTPQPFTILKTTESAYREFKNRFNDEKFISSLKDKNIYELTFKNVGGLVTPIVLAFSFEEGSTVMETIPAEIWRYNEEEVAKVFVFDKILNRVSIDPENLTGDVDRRNNVLDR